MEDDSGAALPVSSFELQKHPRVCLSVSSSVLGCLSAFGSSPSLSIKLLFYYNYHSESVVLFLLIFVIFSPNSRNKWALSRVLLPEGIGKVFICHYYFISYSCLNNQMNSIGAFYLIKLNARVLNQSSDSSR